MTELSLARIDGDGEQLVLTDETGAEYTLRITEELRTAVRRDRQIAERVRATSQPVTPREIQTLLRAGSSVEEVAELSGLTPERIERYEGPVTAERAWVIERAQSLTVGRHPDSPNLGDLALDRLATRKVDPDALEWDAVRGETGPWTVKLSFPVGGRLAYASWEVDLQARSLHALDDEARWLSETDASSPRARRAGLAGVIPVAPHNEQDERSGGSGAGTDALLDSLQQSRGVRQPGLEEDPDLLDSLEGDQAGSDARVIALQGRDMEPGAAAAGGQDDQTKAGERKSKSRRTRRSVPSWDEIVFGAPKDD
ncbi:MAG TPA: septation protein SepH [Actinomycetaceae bacterium]|nr:septation protein SepH [Actinomycetaceae bacterium]